MDFSLDGQKTFVCAKTWWIHGPSALKWPVRHCNQRTDEQPRPGSAVGKPRPWELSLSVIYNLEGYTLLKLNTGISLYGSRGSLRALQVATWRLRLKLSVMNEKWSTDKNVPNQQQNSNFYTKHCSMSIIDAQRFISLSLISDFRHCFYRKPKSVVPRMTVKS